MKKHAADYWILIFAVALTAFGIIMIQSASYYATMDTLGPYYYARKQLISAIVGFVAMVAFWKIIPVGFMKKFGIYIYIVSVGLLILVLVAGTEVNGAKRWIELGGRSIQPSDFAKLGLVFALAQIFSKKRKASENLLNETENPKKKKRERIDSLGWLLFAALLVSTVCILIMKQPNLSTTICIALIAVAMLYAAGLHWGYLVAIGVIVGLLAVYLMFDASYRLQRFSAYLDPWADPLGSGYQLIESLYAVGSGGLTGVGIGQSRQKYLYIPFAESDFIFAIVSEEIGFIGCVCLFAVFLLLIWRGILVAMRSTDPYCSLLATGIVSMIAIQTIINLCVVLGAIPPTGIPLPFISYGGTSLIIMLSSIGILLNLSQRTELPLPKRQLKLSLPKDSNWTNK